MNLGNDVFAQVKSKVTVSEVVEMYHGPVFKDTAICPFHDDTNPSLTLPREKNIFKCFSCGAGGDAITFVSKLKHLSNLEAVRLINNDFKLGIDIPRSRDEHKYEAEKLAVDVAHTNISKAARDYLYAKGLTDSTIETYQIGSDGELIVYPIRNESGRVIGSNRCSFVDRNFYVPGPENTLFSPTKNLGNIDKIRDCIGQPIVITESYRDAILCFQNDIPAVALFGVHMSKEQAEQLMTISNQFILALDNDRTGITHTIKYFQLLKTIDGCCDIKVADFGEFKDVGDYLLHHNSLSTKSVYKYLLEKGIQQEYLIRMICYSPLDSELRIASRLLAESLGVEPKDMFNDLKLRRAKKQVIEKKDKPYKWI